MQTVLLQFALVYDELVLKSNNKFTDIHKARVPCFIRGIFCDQGVLLIRQDQMFDVFPDWYPVTILIHRSFIIENAQELFIQHNLANSSRAHKIDFDWSLIVPLINLSVAPFTNMDLF